LQIFDLLSQKIFRVVAEQVTNARADKAVSFIQVDDENQIGKAFEQISLELFLSAERSFHFPAFGDFHQRTLIADDLARGIADGAGGVLKNANASVCAAEDDFCRPLTSAISIGSTQKCRAAGIRIQGGRG